MARVKVEPDPGHSLDNWTEQRRLATIGTNAGTDTIAFQGWRKFKEAFAPEVVERAVRECSLRVDRVLDPFGGSGTTALAAQFLGCEPTTSEVNPFLADLIEAKLSRYDLASLVVDTEAVFNGVKAVKGVDLSKMPSTFVEPGVNSRWLFSADYADTFSRLLASVNEVEDLVNRRLLKVLLGGVLLETSNTRVSGKGRRYRGSWESRQTSGDDLIASLAARVEAAISDIRRFGNRPEMKYSLHRGDSREISYEPASYELSIFSPPYPNSFDYTDVYNIELWMLGYLTSSSDNGQLRKSTLTSHVQVSRDFAETPSGSGVLDATMTLLDQKRPTLWDPRLPDMVGAYFADMLRVIDRVRLALKPGAEMWMIVGDSRYAGVDVRVAAILGELVAAAGFDLISSEAARSMRASPQQGGAEILPETLLKFRLPRAHV